MRTSIVAIVVALVVISPSACTRPVERPSKQACADEPLVPERAELMHLPRRVFKAPDPGKQRTESAYFMLVVEAPEPGAWSLDGLEVIPRANGEKIGCHAYGASVLAGMRIERPRAPSDTTHRPVLLRLRVTTPIASGVDSAECELHATDAGGQRRRLTVTVPIGVYEQRTALIFPFRGRGLVTQAGIHDGGHSNRSGQFAVDAIGVTAMYAPQLGDADTPESAAGWGREIVAPAAGVVVAVRADRPDQPVTGVSDPAYFLPEFPGGGDPGNFIVIDHENGEFSMLAHFQANSVVVREGQRVAQGDVIGRLGNAGDTNFPHVHYQLMDGKDWMACDALPMRFGNMPSELQRGTWFEARP